MTICVAAICNGNVVIGASDRMITAGDVQFQPKQEKIWNLTNSLVAMISGDVGIQTEIFQEVARIMSERIRTDPTNWWKLKDAAELWRDHYSLIQTKRTEQAVLAPFGLTTDSFIARQKEMSDSFVRQISTEIYNFHIPDISTIIAGNDPSGAHLYVVDNDTVTCRDAAGFAAIGAGWWHANSQFMFSGHTKSSAVSKTLFITFAAKKRAEVAPGVGTETDMFSVGPQLGSNAQVPEEMVKELGHIYEQHEGSISRLWKKVEVKVDDWLKRLVAESTKAQQPQTATEAGDGKTSVDSAPAGTEIAPAAGPHTDGKANAAG